MTMLEAVSAVRCGTIPGVRGVGCVVILGADDTEWTVEDQEGPPYVLGWATGSDARGPVRVLAGDVAGEYELSGWRVDALGGLIG